MTSGQDLPLFASFGARFRKDWKAHLLLTAGAAAIAFGVCFFALKPRYGSTALLILTTERTEIAFDPKFRNLPEDRQEWSIRRRTVEALADCSQVFQRVKEMLGDRVSPSLRSADALAARVSISWAGEALKIHAVTDQPNLSADVANAWAQTVWEVANSVMGARDVDVNRAGQKVKEAEADHRQAQDAVAAFYAENYVDSLNALLRARQREMDEKLLHLNRLKRSADDAAHLLSELKTRQEAALSPFMVSALRTAIVVLRVGILESPSEDWPLHLHIDVQTAEGAAQAATLAKDVEEMVRRLGERIAALDASLRRPEFRTELNELKSRIERLESIEKDLLATRRRRWETYETLSLKFEEARVSSNIWSKLLRLGPPAVPNSNPERKQDAVTVFAAACVALAASVLRSLWKHNRRRRGPGFREPLRMAEPTGVSG